MAYMQPRRDKMVAHAANCTKCSLGRPCTDAQAIVSIKPPTRIGPPTRKPRWVIVKGRVKHWFRTKWYNAFGDK